MDRKIYTIDAKDKPLGRLASEVAALLRGKMRADFARHVNPSDVVRVFNVEAMKVTGNKLEQKRYYRYSGYPGGLKETRLKDVMAADPREALERAVYGMLPKNKLRPLAMRRLFMYRSEIK